MAPNGLAEGGEMKRTYMRHTVTSMHNTHVPNVETAQTHCGWSTCMHPSIHSSIKMYRIIRTDRECATTLASGVLGCQHRSQGHTHTHSRPQKSWTSARLRLNLIASRQTVTFLYCLNFISTRKKKLNSDWRTKIHSIGRRSPWIIAIAYVCMCVCAFGVSMRCTWWLTKISASYVLRAGRVCINPYTPFKCACSEYEIYTWHSHRLMGRPLNFSSRCVQYMHSAMIMMMNRG